MSKYFLILLASACAHAGIGPDVSSEYWLHYNDSYLSDTKTMAPTSISRQDLISDKKVEEITQQYDDLTRTYLLKQQFGLVDMKTQSDYESQMSNFSHTVWQVLQQKQMQEETEKFKNSIGNSELLSAIAKPATAAGAIVAVYQGQPVDVKLSDNSKISVMTNFTNQTAYLKVHSCDLDGSFEFNNNPNLAADMNPYSTIEQYKTSVSKNVPLGVTAGTMYGFTSTYLTSFVRRGIVKNVTCELDYVDPVSPQAFSLRPPEAVIKFTYGFKF